MTLQHFWFQCHVGHLSVRTVIQLFMVSLTASKLSKEFWSSKRQRTTASDFSSNLKATGSEQFIHKISERYTGGFCTQRCMEYTDLTNFEYLPRILKVLMVLALILSKTWNDFNMLFSRYNEKSSIFLGKELYRSLLKVFLGWGKIMKKYVAYYNRKTRKLEKNLHKEYLLLMWFL